MKERRSCKKQNDSSSQLGVCALLPPPPPSSLLPSSGWQCSRAKSAIQAGNPGPGPMCLLGAHMA